MSLSDVFKQLAAALYLLYKPTSVHLRHKSSQSVIIPLVHSFFFFSSQNTCWKILDEGAEVDFFFNEFTVHNRVKYDQLYGSSSAICAML